MSAPNYTPESTALPSGHLAGLRLGVRGREFIRDLNNLIARWPDEWKLWLAAHDTGQEVTLTTDGQAVPLSEVEITPDGRVIHAGNAQGNDGDGGEEEQA